MAKTANESVLTFRPQETSIVDGKWYLGEDFISQFRGKQPKWGFDGFGWVVYIRTYSREKADGTLESWWETTERVTMGNYNTMLTAGDFKGELDPTITKEELERFYFLFFNLAFTPPGRSLWMSGTEYSESNGDAMNNCWYVDIMPQARRSGDLIRPSTPFVFVMDQAMKGGGVGAGVYKENVAQFPVTNNEVEITFILDSFHGDAGEMEQGDFEYITSTGFVYHEDRDKGKYISVDDSREGWTDNVLAEIIDAHYKPFSEKRLFIDLNNVRSRGEKIVRFGGTASGIVPLVSGVLKINRILNRTAAENRKITDVEAGDLVQIIGTIVVAGNVRRTAIILMGSKDSQDFINSKDYSKMGFEPSQWRWASNNSIVIDTKTTREEIYEAGAAIFYNGEPGIVNMELSRNYGRIVDGEVIGIDGRANGTNPCGEITLENMEPCNLFEINMVRCMELGGESVLLEAAYLATRYTYRVTFRPYDWEQSRNVIEANRRLGVGITAYSDYTLIYHDGDYEATAPVLNRLYLEVDSTNFYHAKSLGTNPSIKKTTVKPSGSVSKLMGTSAGQHDHWDEHIIQRIRISSDAPIMDLIYQCGYPVEPNISGRDEDGNPIYDYKTLVVEFPIKAPTAGHPNFKPASEVPLMDQAARQAVLQTYWADNAVSATLTFHKPGPDNNLTEEEVINDITNVLDTYKTVFKSTSLLPHATGTYDQMPWETITEEEYNKRMSRLKGRPWDFMTNGLQASEEEDLDSSLECIGNNCPIK